MSFFFLSLIRELLFRAFVKVILRGLINKKRESETEKRRQQREADEKMNKREGADERRPGLGREGGG